MPQPPSHSAYPISCFIKGRSLQAGIIFVILPSQNLSLRGMLYPMASLVNNRLKGSSPSKSDRPEMNFASIRTIAALTRKGELRPEEHVRHCLALIKRVNPLLNALSATNAHALESASKLPQRGARRLQGVTFSAKENILVKGLPASDGSR